MDHEKLTSSKRKVKCTHWNVRNIRAPHAIDVSITKQWRKVTVHVYGLRTFSGLMLFLEFQLKTFNEEMALFNGWWKLESNRRFSFLVPRVQLPLKNFSCHLNSFGSNTMSTFNKWFSFKLKSFHNSLIFEKM